MKDLEKPSVIREAAITPEEIELLRHGNQAVFKKVYMHYMAPLKRFLCSLIPSTDKAEDIVTDTFVVLWTKRASLDPQKNVRSLLFTIARNKIINSWNRLQIHEHFCMEQQAASASSADFSPEELTIAKETRLLIELVVQNMPALRRKVFELHQKDFNNDTIACKLNIPKANVANHISRAKKDIKAALK